MPGSSEDRLPSQGRKPSKRAKRPVKRVVSPDDRALPRSPEPKRRRVGPKVRRAAESVGEAAVKGSRQVRRGVESDVGQVLLESRIERAMLLKRIKDSRGRDLNALQTFHERYGKHGDSLLDAIKHGASDTGSFYESLGRGAINEVSDPVGKAKRFYDFASKPGPGKYEKTADVTVGKSASNLLFHGDTSHPLEAGLEAGSLLPLGKLLKGLGLGAKGVMAAEDAARATRTAKAAPARRMVNIEGQVGHIETVNADDLPALVQQREAEVAAFKDLPNTSENRRAYRKATDRLEATVKALEADQPDAEHFIRQALKAAPAASKERKAQVSKARAEKIQKADEAGTGLAGEEQLHAELGAMKGEIQATPFELLREGNLPEEHYQELLNRVKASKALRPYEKVRARQALQRAYRQGKPLRDSEIRDLETVFGADARELKKPKLASFTDVVGIPRSLQASADISFPMRQGLVLGARHPVISAKGTKRAMMPSLVSEKHYEGNVLGKIHADPDYEEAMNSGLDITELAPSSRLQEGVREEQFPSALVEHPVNVKGVNVNVPGRIVRASGRAFTAQADYVRFAAYKRQKELALKAGANWDGDAHLRESMAKFINTASGRGDLGRLTKFGPAANALFFSPKLLKSRLDLLNPVWYAKLHPRARREAARAMVNLGIAVTGVAAAAVELGSQVGHDPRSSDFAKIKVGDTRFDTLGGLGQYMTFVSRMAPSILGGGGTVNAQGKFVPFGPAVGEQTRWDLALRFVRSKGSPPVGLAADILDKKNFVGDPVTPQSELYRMTVPLVVQDTIDLYGNDKNVPLALLGYGIASTGIGMQTYKAQTTTQKQVSESKQKYQDWHDEATQTWHKSGGAGDLPAEVVRAKRNQIQVTNARVALKDQLGVSKLSDKQELAVMVGVLAEQPQFSQYKDTWLQQVSEASPADVTEILPVVKRRLGYTVLDQFGVRKKKYERAQAEKRYQAQH